MDLSLKRMLGLDSGEKRQYRFVSGEVTKEEFEYCQLLDVLLFGKDGYVETLGSTWDLIHDPRFSKIEDTFIVNRKAVFGGDAMVGKQYISSDGAFTSSIADLEQYSEILGEGRYFCYVLIHPDKECPVRNWYLRIFPGMADKGEVPQASPDLLCECKSSSLDPHDVHRWSVPDTWALIKQECPNYFTKEDKPNGVAQRLFDLFRADLLGLIFDYAITPMSDVFISLDTGDVFNQQEQDTLGSSNHVFLEVDILEKALTQRAVLRATAAKILRQIDFQNVIKEELGDDFILTEYERDQILRLVYNPSVVMQPTEAQFTVANTSVVDPDNNWYLFRSVISKNVLQFLQNIKATGLSAAEREKQQLAEASSKAHATFAKLRSGEISTINQYTEPKVDVNLDAHAQILEKILKDPIRQELFMMWVEAESRGNVDNTNNEDRLRMSQLYSILTPIFTDAEFLLNEETFLEYQKKALDLGFYGEPRITQVEEEFHSDNKKFQFQTP